jgi:hypothetical protein
VSAFFGVSVPINRSGGLVAGDVDPGTVLEAKFEKTPGFGFNRGARLSRHLFERAHFARVTPNGDFSHVGRAMGRVRLAVTLGHDRRILSPMGKRADQYSSHTTVWSGADRDVSLTPRAVWWTCPVCGRSHARSTWVETILAYGAFDLIRGVHHA